MIISIGRDGKWNNHELNLRWREKEDGKWVRKDKLVQDFTPYLFIQPDNFHSKNQKTDEFPRKIAKHSIESQIKDKYRDAQIVTKSGDTGFQDAKGNVLWKVELPSPSFVRGFTKHFWPTFEADVPYEDRYLIDNVNTMEEYPMRKFFFDIEALQFVKGENPEYCLRPNDPRDNQEICLIGGYDSYSKKYYQWIQHPNYDNDIQIKKFDGKETIAHYFSDERLMLEHFIEFIEITDPDVLLAWGMGFYDLPTLYRRLESLGIGAERLSPAALKGNRHVDSPFFKGIQYRWTQQPIRGRLVVSLDRLFERIYRDSKSTNLPSMKLDIVGQKLFGRGKTEFRPDFYDADYDKWGEDYLYYNFRDVDLMIDVDSQYNLIEGQQDLQSLAICQFKSTFYGSSYARVYFTRKAHFKQKTGWEYGGDTLETNLQGAIVLDPEEIGSVGLHKNTVILDFTGLYPSMMVAYNASWETKVLKGEESDDDIIGDRCRFKRNPQGILPASVKELDELRDLYKARRDGCAEKGDTKGYQKWDAAQKTVKRLRATFYGLMAFKGFAWGDMDIARTITYGGRKALKSIMDETEKFGYKVLYGHTDSIFVALGDDLTAEECAEKAEYLSKHLTDIVQKELQSNAVVVEAEMIMDRFFLPRRNRYAGRVIWQPGSGETPFDIGKLPVDDRIKMQGLEAKHTNTAKIGRDIQINAIKMIWDEKEAEEVLSYLQNFIKDIKDNKVDSQDMVARARLGKWLPNVVQGHMKYASGSTNERAHPEAKDETDQSYSILGGNQKAAAWHNIVLADDTFSKLDKGDSYYVTFAKDGPTWIPSGGYIGFHDFEQIDQYELDIDLIIEKNVISKLDHILYGIGLSNDLLRDNLPKQRKLEDYM